jgi:hypothetical protein
MLTVQSCCSLTPAGVAEDSPAAADDVTAIDVTDPLLIRSQHLNSISWCQEDVDRSAALLVCTFAFRLLPYMRLQLSKCTTGCK